jgi:hypothetical protein
MVGTISPMVHGARSLQERMAVSGAHTLGAIMGSSLIGACLSSVGYLGSLIIPSWFISSETVLLIFLTALILEGLSFFRIPLPESKWRVRRSWMLLPQPVGSWLFGFVLGLGVATRIPSRAFYALIAWCIFVADPTIGALAFAGYGVGRAIPVLAAGFSTGPTPRSEWAIELGANLAAENILNVAALIFLGTGLLCERIRI